MSPGEVFFLAFPSEVVRVTFVREGDDGKIFRRPKRNPVVVRDEHEEFVVEREALHANPLAAAIESERLAREMES